MAIQFPEELDSFLNPQPTDSVAIVSHAEQHSNANDAIEALEAKVGTDNSLVSTSHDYRIRQLELNPVTGTASKIEQIVVNNTGSTLLKGQVVYASGSVGASGKLRVSLSSNSTESGSSKTFGVLAENIINGGEGILVTEGLLEGVDTTGAADGDPVWLGPTAGSKIFGLTEKPSAPAHLVFLGIVVRGENANNGSIFVKIQNGFELEELHNVSIATLSDNQVLRYDASTQLWKNETIDDLFDPAGAAATAQSNAEDYADGLAVNYDPAGAAATAQSNAEDYADGLAVNYDPAGAAAQALLDAQGYADGLATNYDPAGSASTAETNANTYTDTELNDYTPTVSLDTTVGGYGYLKSADLSGYATESYVGTAIGNIIDGAPALLDTLNELAAAIGDDENFVTTINNALATKITASSLDTLTNKTISIQSGLTSVVGYDDITGFYGQSDIPVIQGGLDKGGRINISSEGVITQSAPGTGYTSGLAIIGGGTRVAIGTSNNTIIGNLSDFNAALLDADFATTVDITNAIQDANDYTDTAIAGLGNDIEAGYIPVTEKATAGGVASLDLSGKVPDTQLDIDSTIQDVASSMITGGTHTNISTSFDNVTKKLSFSTTPLTQEQIQDFVAPLLNHSQHTNITATYDDDNNRIVLQGSSSSGGGASVTISPTAPTSPTLGNIWLDSDNGSTFIWDGVYWIEIGASGTAEAIAAVTSTAPVSPVLGKIWLNSTTAKTYIYDGSYWVEI
jgi:hypothetical protein